MYKRQGLMIGTAIGLVIRCGASTGGMDIPPLILNKKLGIPISVSMYGFDFIILLGQMVIRNREMVFYGILLVPVSYTHLKALCFVRDRYSLPNGDFDRGKNQQKLLKAMLEKAMSPKIITNFNNILTAIEGSFETDMSSKEIKSLLNMQLNDMSDWTVYNVQVEGEGYKTSKTASMYGTEVYVMKPYQKQVKKIKKIIDTVEQGGTISEEDLKGLGN